MCVWSSRAQLAVRMAAAARRYAGRRMRGQQWDPRARRHLPTARPVDRPQDAIEKADEACIAHANVIE